MLKWFYAENTACQVNALFNINYLNQQVPNNTMIDRIIHKFETTGKLLNNCKCYLQNLTKPRKMTTPLFWRQ